VSLLELNDIQDIVAGYPRFPWARYLFVRLGGDGGLWLGRMADQITTADRNGGRGSSALNVALTWSGLGAIGAPDATLDSFPAEFKAGMAQRGPQLGDTEDGRDASANWERPGPGTTDIHAVAIVHAETEAALENRSMAVRRFLAGRGEVVATQDGHRLHAEAAFGGEGNRRFSREHFGFLDGISQPILEGMRPRPDALPGQGVLDRDGTWRPLRAGEIVLGYRDEEGDVALSPRPSSIGRNGTYLVYRKLQQHVAAFRRVVEAEGARYPGGPAELAAKIVGRRRDGSPLRDPRTAGARPADGAFTFADDRQGLGCPIGSHVRRANPRDGVAARDRIVHRHRMLRRGISYGPPLAEGVLEDDGRERGLLFVCLCASIGRQFEFVQGQWLNDGNSLGLAGAHDPLLSKGNDRSNLTIPGERPWMASGLDRLVTVRGGEYFFLPGRRALIGIAVSAVAA
jgi:Dyp-type peroxidase family